MFESPRGHQELGRAPGRNLGCETTSPSSTVGVSDARRRDVFAERGLQAWLVRCRTGWTPGSAPAGGVSRRARLSAPRSRATGRVS